MIKFGIALCILLVVAGTQGSTSYTAHRVIEITANSFYRESESLVASLSERVTIAAKYEQYLMEQINSTAQDATTEWEEKIAELKTNSSDVDTCVSSNGDFLQASEDDVSSLKLCIVNALTDIESNYEAIIASLEAVTSYINEISLEAENCGSDDKTAVACVTEVFEKRIDEVSSEWAALDDDVKALHDDIANFATISETCGITSIKETLASDLTKYYNNVEECISESNASDS